MIVIHEPAGSQTADEKLKFFTGDIVTEAERLKKQVCQYLKTKRNAGGINTKKLPDMKYAR
ncbi:hypothetical protein [Methanoplanus endosymbiosus]|uniref:Uncharacterized protein n=1 Tax=Methanoplanus endosymbiosus TaxID=33865 RepID=A0A9E7PJT5_9EURY|nr:hypothetical protein [Methanoplanus endosymbiosus]UUX91268.1 hypothetical protein L6E24_07715 [Methanoplanus endosymbiosus]